MASRLIARGNAPGWRTWWRIAALVVVLAILIVPHVVWRLFSRRTPAARLFLRAAGWIVGARVTTTGLPIRHNALYIANHLSWLDILVLAGQTGCAFVAKAEMASWPLIGWLTASNNSVFVERDSRASVRRQTGALERALATGQPITLFPEGTTARGHELLPFRSSLIAAVTPPPEGVAIQPVAIDYGPLAAEIAWADPESFGHNALRVLNRRGTIPVCLNFLAPLDHRDFDDRKAIALHSRQEIAGALGLG